MFSMVMSYSGLKGESCGVSVVRFRCKTLICFLMKPYRVIDSVRMELIFTFRRLFLSPSSGAGVMNVWPQVVFLHAEYVPGCKSKTRPRHSADGDGDSL
jgi:hypothetical protein